MTSPMIEPTQADRDAAERWGTGPVYNMYHLAKAFARHRLASTPASGEVDAWMYTHSEPGSWPQIFPERMRQSFGPNWTETPLYRHAAPSHPAADLVEAAQAVIDNTYVGRNGQTVVERSKYGHYEAKYYHRLRAALSRYANGGA